MTKVIIKKTFRADKLLMIFTIKLNLLVRMPLALLLIRVKLDLTPLCIYQVKQCKIAAKQFYINVIEGLVIEGTFNAAILNQRVSAFLAESVPAS